MNNLVMIGDTTETFREENLQELTRLATKLGTLESELTRARSEQLPHHCLSLLPDGRFGDRLPPVFAARLGLSQAAIANNYFWDTAIEPYRSELIAAWENLKSGKIHPLNCEAQHQVKDRLIAVRWIVNWDESMTQADAIAIIEINSVSELSPEIERPAYFDDIPPEIKITSVFKEEDLWIGSLVVPEAMFGQPSYFISDRSYPNVKLRIDIALGKCFLGLYPDTADTVHEMELARGELYIIPPRQKFYLRFVDQCVLFVTGEKVSERRRF